MPENADALKRVLGVSYKIASNALSELESLGLVVSSKTSLKGRGRPAVTCFSGKPVTVCLINLSTISDILSLKHEIKACIYVFDRLLFGKVKKYPETFDEAQQAYIESFFKGLRKETLQCIKVALLRCVVSEVVRRAKESELNAVSEGQFIRVNRVERWLEPAVSCSMTVPVSGVACGGC